jgi:hypothetical protein
MTSPSSTTCLNCATPLTGLYSSQCGQKVPRGDLTLAELFGAGSQLAVYHFRFGPEARESCVIELTSPAPRLHAPQEPVLAAHHLSQRIE